MLAITTSEKTQHHNFCIHELKHHVTSYHLHIKMHTKALASYSYLQLPQKNAQRTHHLLLLKIICCLLQLLLWSPAYLFLPLSPSSLGLSSERYYTKLTY